ncbi:MAG TPA: HAMP domain-containing sensor histidine kinase [Candidatus Limnocylindrales bacterium]
MRPHNRPPWWPDDEPWPPVDPAELTAEQHRALHGETVSVSGDGSSEARREGPSEWGSAEWRRNQWRSGRWGSGNWGSGNSQQRIRRGFGCIFVLIATLIVSIGVLVLWLLGSLLGIVSDDGLLGTLARSAGLVVLVVGLIALVFGGRFTRRVGVPLAELVEAAGRIEAADYSVRVAEPERGRGELRGLGRAFNAMAARLEAEDATRRRLLADVSHELRTPLAVIQGNLEALLDGVYPPDAAHIDPILDETRVLERLIDDLRTLSLAESGALPLHRETTEPAILLEDVAAAHRARAAAGKVELRVEVEGGLPSIDIDPVRMRQVVSNLVDNAIRVMPDGGTVTLSAVRRDGSLIIEVTDDGPGIPSDLLPTVFERFSKSTESRGSGLGLSIARAIVTAHGGTILAISPVPGAANGKPGTTIRISLELG